ncbi:MAG: HAD family phosphatase [Candidatus Binatia bacterium]
MRLRAHPGGHRIARASVITRCKVQAAEAKVNTRMLRAILFDFDGTIAQSEPLHFAAFAETLAERHVSLPQALYYARYLGLTDAECVERMLDDFGRRDLRADVAALLRRKAEIMARRMADGVPLCPGVAPFIARAAGHAAVAIVSGALRVEIDRVLEDTGLRPYFRLVLSAENVGRGKPDPEGYRLACARLRELGVADLDPRQCLVVEDAPKGIEAARAAGMRVVALPHTCRAEALAAADRVYNSYAEIDWKDLESLYL